MPARSPSFELGKLCTEADEARRSTEREAGESKRTNTVEDLQGSAEEFAHVDNVPTADIRQPARTGAYDDHRQYSVVVSNRGGRSLSDYGYRWELESGYRSIERFLAATASKNFGLRFFYFAFACLLYSIWRAVDYSCRLN